MQPGRLQRQFWVRTYRTMTETTPTMSRRDRPEIPDDVRNVESGPLALAQATNRSLGFVPAFRNGARPFDRSFVQSCRGYNTSGQRPALPGPVAIWRLRTYRLEY